MEKTEHRLIESLKELPGVEDQYHAKRLELRMSLRSKAPLDLRLANGVTMVVSAMDVSDTGIGFLCPEALKATEEIELRIAYQDDDGFESFQVRRATSTIGGFKVGAVAD